MTPHPQSSRLDSALRRALTRISGWEGDLFRFSLPRYATAAELLTGKGALRSGGRWHPIGAFPAVYLSLSPETAVAEALQQNRRFGLPDSAIMPRTMNAVRARLHVIFDLTDGEMRQRLSLSEQRIRTEEWWLRTPADEEAVTQAVGRIAFEIGFEGLLVPSAVDRHGKNMVVFPGRLRPDSELMIYRPEELPGSFL